MSIKAYRRDFLKTILTGGAVAGFPSIIPSSALGKDGAVSPSERISVGLIGCGNRSAAANTYHGYEKSEIVAVCDPIKQRRLVKAQQFGGCPDYSDFRELLANKDVDAVHISTADHWHVPISLAAARAGKDLYTEKPLGISIEQDLAARQIMDKYNRVFQYGAQNRSTAQTRMGLELVLNGHIGEVEKIYIWCPPGQAGGSATPELPIPDGFDYNLWLGPAPQAPYCRDRIGGGVHNGIFHIYDYAIGFIAGWGAHPTDTLQWWADNTGMGIPVTYKGIGTIPAEGLFNTITHWDIEGTYANGLKMRFMDGPSMRKTKDIPHIGEIPFGHGVLFVGSEGAVAVSRGTWKLFPDTLRMKAKDPGKVRLMVSKNHQRNFIDSVASRKQPVGDLASAVRSDIICHLSNICIRTGKTIQWDPAKETILGNPEAIKMMSRPMRKPWRL